MLSAYQVSYSYWKYMFKFVVPITIAVRIPIRYVPVPMEHHGGLPSGPRQKAVTTSSLHSQVLLSVNLTQDEPTTYGTYVFPPWTSSIGYGVNFISVVLIPVGAVLQLSEEEGTFMEVWRLPSDRSNK